MGLTWIQHPIAGLSSQPRLAILRVIKFGDEGEVTGYLPIVFY